MEQKKYIYKFVSDGWQYFYEKKFNSLHAALIFGCTENYYLIIFSIFLFPVFITSIDLF